MSRLEQTADAWPDLNPEPHVVSSNETGCYTCALPFAKLHNDYVIARQYQRVAPDGRIHAYTLKLCVWCDHQHRQPR